MAAPVQSTEHLGSSDIAAPGKHNLLRPVKLNPIEIKRLRNVYYNQQFPALCRRMLLEMILKEEPVFTMGGKSYMTSDTDPVFREVVRTNYMPFLQGCFDEIMLTGIAVVKIVRNQRGDRVPSVIPSDSFGRLYDLVVYTDPQTGGPTYKLHKLRKRDGTPMGAHGGKVDKNAFIFSTFSTGPSVRGEIRSVISTILPTQIYYDRMMNFSMQADYNLSDPSLITETGPEAAAGIPAHERDIPMYDPNDALETELDRLYAKDAENRRHVREHIDLQLRNKPSWTPDGSSRLKKTIEDNSYSLPQGHHYVQGPTAQRRTDLIDMIREYQTIVASSFGIPKSMIIQDVSMRTGSTVHLVETTIGHTIGRWSKIMSQILTDVTRCIYFPDECNIVFGILAKDPKNKDVPLETLLRQASEIASVQVTLPIVPSKDPVQSLFLMLQGIITWEEYAAHQRALGGYPPGSVSQQPPAAIWDGLDGGKPTTAEGEEEGPSALQDNLAKVTGLMIKRTVQF
jgi:hypothetical protein